MARQTIEIITCDLTGERLKPDQVEPVGIFEGDRHWFVDLGPAGLKAWNKAIEPFRQAADPDRMKVAKRITEPRKRVAPKMDKEQRDVIRGWWRNNYVKAGLPEPTGTNQGRIPGAVVDSYNAAEGKPLTKHVK